MQTDNYAPLDGWHNSCAHLFLTLKFFIMPGRGDNNKHGSAGRGASNQSNQPFVADEENQPKSNHDKKHTGGHPSEPSPKTADQDANRNQHLKQTKQEEQGNK